MKINIEPFVEMTSLPSSWLCLVLVRKSSMAILAATHCWASPAEINEYFLSLIHIFTVGTTGNGCWSAME